MLTRQDLHKISKTRLEEAKILYDNGEYDGAKYLLGYALETALKARICKVLDFDYPDKENIKGLFTHNFDSLIVLAGLGRQLEEKKKNDSTFNSNWSLITDSTFGWKESLRYEKIGSASPTEIEDLFNALEDKSHGVLTWIRKKW